MILSGWGNYPKRWSNYFEVYDENKLKNIKDFIIRGEGRSYGDAAVGKNTIKLVKKNFFLSFNEQDNTLKVEGGTTINEILNFLIKKNKFLPVVPGTKFITIGGAISSDVHGKNHHVSGSFCNYVRRIEVLLSDGQIIEVNKDNEIFKGICGGMGLIGIILSAELELVEIPSPFLYQRTLNLQNLEDVLSAFDYYKDWEYSVAWYDFFSNKALILLGRFIKHEGKLKNYKSKKIFPVLGKLHILNKASIRIYNLFYYLKSIFRKERVVDFNSFFFPLDNILNWNVLYGEKGFIQYQFVVPYKEFIKEVFSYLKKHGILPYLTVIKKMGKGNSNFLSFPKEGFTVALDFPVNIETLKILDLLDEELIKAKGRIYLAKDGRMSRKIFLNMDYKLHEFLRLKEELDPKNKLMSYLWRRIYYGR